MILYGFGAINRQRPSNSLLFEELLTTHPAAAPSAQVLHVGKGLSVLPVCRFVPLAKCESSVTQYEEHKLKSYAHFDSLGVNATWSQLQGVDAIFILVQLK